MRVLICGDRNWKDSNLIESFVSSLPKYSIIIEGEARGADSMARIAAEKYGYECLRFPADWNQFGKSAGYIRNAQMIKEGEPDLVVAYHEDIENGHGTRNMANISIKAGLPVYVNLDSYVDIEMGIAKPLVKV